MADVHRNAVAGLEAGRGSVETLLAAAAALGLRLDGRSLPPGDGLGERIRALRMRRGLSQSMVARLAGVSSPSVGALERGRSQHIAVLESVARVIGAALCLVPLDKPLNFWNSAGNSSVHHEWTTPGWVLDRLEAILGGPWDMDPCSPGARVSRVRAHVHMSVEENGLKHQWTGRVFVNPPYGRQLGSWMAKCRSEVEANNASLVVALIPARPDTRWWHSEVAGRADILMLKGRLSFGDGSASAPFPSALIAWGATADFAAAVTAAFPDAWHIPPTPKLSI